MQVTRQLMIAVGLLLCMCDLNRPCSFDERVGGRPREGRAPVAPASEGCTHGHVPPGSHPRPMCCAPIVSILAEAAERPARLRADFRAVWLSTPDPVACTATAIPASSVPIPGSHGPPRSHLRNHVLLI